MSALARCAAAAVLCSGCIRTTDEFVRVNLQRLNDGDDMVLVGSVHVVMDGREQTKDTSFETDGPSGSFQLPESGSVIWVVSQHRSEELIHLTWLATPYSESALGLRNLVVLARGDAAGKEHCWYFGKVTVDFSRTADDLRAGAIVGWALPQGIVTQIEDDPQHRAALAHRYPSLSGLECTAAASGATVTFP